MALNNTNNLFMKKIITLIFTTLLLANITYSQDRSLAKVEKVSGKYAFVNCEPVSEYEVVFYVDIKMVWSNK